MNNNESKNKAVFIRSFSICPIDLSINIPSIVVFVIFYLREILRSTNNRCIVSTQFVVKN